MCSLWTLAACVIAAATGPFAGAQGALGADEEARIAELVRASGIPSASVAVVEHGELVYAKAFGKASLAPERAADASTRYFVGSVSKQFTAAAILLAAEEGKLSLDDRVSRFYLVRLRGLRPAGLPHPRVDPADDARRRHQGVGGQAAGLRAGHALAVQQHELRPGCADLREGDR
jgi:hypothetical protein